MRALTLLLVAFVSTVVGDGDALAEITEKVFFDIEIDGETTGRIVFGLFGNVVPKTVKNFATLCDGSAGVGNAGKPLHFQGSSFHRIIPGFMAQGGDFTARNGTGGESIYGNKFADENFTLKHKKPFLLSMANAGPNTNGSQFFICYRDTPHLDNKHTIYGRVINGWDICEKAESVKTGQQDVPEKPIQIVDCGELKNADKLTADNADFLSTYATKKD